MTNLINTIQTAAAQAQKFGTRKAYIASVYDNMPAEYRARRTLSTFKMTLVELNRTGDVAIVRGDLVGAMDRKMLDASEIVGHNSCECYHFVEV